MKKKTIVISLSLIMGGLLYFSNVTNTQAYYYGPLAGYTGSPHDGKTCDYSGCHNSHSLQSAQPWITSNVPAAGYSPDTVYTITAKAVKIGYGSFGFEISPQTTGGSPLGKMIVTNSNTTQLLSVGSLQYMEQTQYGYSATDSMTWTFHWKAPAAGSGSVTFYGAFNCGNGNSVATGTYVYPATLIIPENVNAGINSLANNSSTFSLFPNPASKQVSITYTLQNRSNVELTMYGLDGRKVYTLLNSTENAGEHIQTIPLPLQIVPGIYIMQLLTGYNFSVQRIVVEK